MKTLLTTAAAVALVAGSAQAATLHGLAGSANNQANFGATTGITISTGSLGGDIYLQDVQIDARLSGSPGGTIGLDIYIDSDNDASTWGLGALVAQSTNTNTWTDGATSTWNFAFQPLADNTVYTVVFTDGAGTNISTGFGLVNGATDAGTTMFQNSGSAAFAGSHEAAISVTTSAVPEPSSTALLGLGGLALILRRRK